MGRVWAELAALYQQHIIESGKQPQAVILVSFLITFVVVRLMTYRIHAHRARHLHDISIGGTHIHHLVWGIWLLLLTGYLAIAFGVFLPLEPIALFFGIGAALTLDEFALWLHLEDVYWSREGRWSVDVVIIVAVVLGLIMLGAPFWRDAGRTLVALLSGG